MTLQPLPSEFPYILYEENFYFAYLYSMRCFKNTALLSDSVLQFSVGSRMEIKRMLKKIAQAWMQRSTRILVYFKDVKFFWYTLVNIITALERVCNMRKAVMYLNIKLSWRAQYSRGVWSGIYYTLGPDSPLYPEYRLLWAHTHRTQTGSGTGSPEIASTGLTSKDRVGEQRRIYM
jgi:hypothetical protein